MKTAIRFGMLAAVVFAVVASEASAQRQTGRSRPPGRSGYTSRLQRSTVSPYLNLNRLGTSGVPNYYTLVRPQLQQQVINYEQSAAVGTLDREFAGRVRRLERETLPPTGHASQRLYYSHFYNYNR